ncbi:acyl carrier protein [Calditrichota bacterium GD2]
MKEKFLQVLKEALEIEDYEINLSDNFQEYPDWDSLSQLNLIAMLDEEFNVSIETKDLEQLKTVEDLWKEVEKRMQKD